MTCSGSGCDTDGNRCVQHGGAPPRVPSRWRVYFRDANDSGPGTLEIVADAWAQDRAVAIREGRARLIMARPERVLRFVRIEALEREATRA